MYVDDIYEAELTDVKLSSIFKGMVLHRFN